MATTVTPYSSAHRIRTAVARPLVGDGVVLDLDVVVVAEDVEVVLEHLAGLGLPFFQDRLEHLALEAARRGHQPRAVLAERVAVDPGLVVEPVGVAHRRELDQVLVALEVLGQQHLVVPRPVAGVGHARRRDVELAPDDRAGRRPSGPWCRTRGRRGDSRGP